MAINSNNNENTHEQNYQESVSYGSYILVVKITP